MKRPNLKMYDTFFRDFFRKDRLLILFLSGILLLIIAIPVNPKQEKEQEQNTEEGGIDSSDHTSMERYTKYLETQLEEILSLTEHAGEIRVMITLKDGGEKVVEKDRESNSEMVEEADSEGGTRTSNSNSVKEVSVYNREDIENGTPYITKEKSPEVSGVLVISQGGDNAVVVQNITEAIQALFDIDTHKIKVIKGN